MTATDQKATATEWARVARAKYDHYKALCDSYEQNGKSANYIGLKNLEASLARTVPHLADAIDQLAGEVERLRAVLARVESVTMSTDGDRLRDADEIPVGVVVQALYDTGRMS